MPTYASSHFINDHLFIIYNFGNGHLTSTQQIGVGLVTPEGKVYNRSIRQKHSQVGAYNISYFEGEQVVYFCYAKGGGPMSGFKAYHLAKFKVN